MSRFLTVTDLVAGDIGGVLFVHRELFLVGETGDAVGRRNDVLEPLRWIVRRNHGIERSVLRSGQFSRPVMVSSVAPQVIGKPPSPER